MAGANGLENRQALIGFYDARLCLYKIVLMFGRNIKRAAACKKILKQLLFWFWSFPATVGRILCKYVPDFATLLFRAQNLTCRQEIRILLEI